MRASRQFLTLFLLLFTVTVFRGAARSAPISVMEIMGFEHRPERQTIDNMIILSAKLKKTAWTIGGFGQYRYDIDKNHAYQTLLGINVGYKLSKRNSLRCTFAFVEVYGLRRPYDTDRASFSFSRLLLKAPPRINMNFSLTYSTQTDWTSNKHLSTRLFTTIKGPAKKNTEMGFGYAVDYVLDNKRIGQERLEFQQRVNLNKKDILTFKYAAVIYHHPRSGSDNVYQINFAHSF